MLFPDVHTQNPVQKERKKKTPAKKQLKTTKTINKNVNNRGKVKQTKISYQDSDAETVEPIDDFSDSDSPEIEQVKNDVLVSDSPKFERAKRIPKSNRPKKTVSPLKANKNSHLRRKRSDTTEKNEKVVKNNSRIIKKKSRHHPLLGRYLLHKGAGHPCNWCPSSYRFASGLLFHVRTRHNDSVSRLRSARCRKLLHCAKQRTIPSFECKFEVGSENLGNKKFPCLLCSKKFLFRSLLTSHVKKHFPFRRISTDILDTKTKICLSTDPLKKNQLRNDVKKEEGIESPTKRRRTKLETVLFCSICSTSLPNENLFKDHMIANHPTVIYQCPHCTFSTRIETVYRRYSTL